MSESRLKAKLWVQATVRTCFVQGLAATVVRSGDADAGAVLIKQNLGAQGFVVLTQVRTPEGLPAWMKGTGPDPVAEAAADAYIARQVDRDWDLWVIEIEDREGRLPFDTPVL
jgi:GMP synthase (glutamine-hydrolysing)